MKIVGTFDPKQLYQQQKNTVQDSGFDAIFSLKLGEKSGKQDVSGLFGSNGSDLERIYEQMTGKKLDDNTVNNTEVFSFYDSQLIPFTSMTSNQNMRYAIR